MRPLLALALLALSCTSGPDPLPPEQVGAPFAFAREAGAVLELSVPARSRPGEGAAPDRGPIQGPFTAMRTVDGVTTWEAPLPIRPRNLFFHRALPGMELRDGQGKLSFGNGMAGSKRARSWDFTAKTVLIRRPAADGPPADGEYEMVYARAGTREDALNLETSAYSAYQASAEPGEEADGAEQLALAQKMFAFRSLQLGEDTRTGLLLPAPSTAAWQVTVPTGGALTLDATVMPPELDTGAASDGARLFVDWVPEGGAAEVLLERALDVGDWAPILLDLSDRAGQTARIRFRTDGGPDGETSLDYVFLAEPTLYSPERDPDRLVLVFIDTLRPDHMGTYGYERDTTPKLDAWAEGAAVFENARSIAPWTLPSARTALSGRQPELWQAGPRLQERLARAGYITGAFVGNIYLSSNFEMSAGWAQYGCVNWPVAEVQIEKVRGFLDRYPDRDAAVMLHLMDMHLPYTEPPQYTRIWAGEAPEGLPERGAARSQVLAAAKKDLEGTRQYLIDRYDQNMRYLDDQLSALFEELGDDATIVIFADHGEEFWDHDEFEHGHSLYDELLRVPMIVKAPGLPAARVAAPVSLLDLTPTVLDLAGLSQGDVSGRSLIPAIRGDAQEIAALNDRDQAFGRPLYGEERWGVLSQGKKWSIHQGVEHVHDLTHDPGETEDVRREVDLDELRARFASQLSKGDDWTSLLWRVDPSTGSSRKDVTLELSHPEGFADAWLGADYLNQSDMELEFTDDGRAIVTFKAGARGAREIYLQPSGDPLAFGGLRLQVTAGDKTTEAGADPEDAARLAPDGRKRVLLRARGGGRSFVVTWGVAPKLAGEVINASDAEVAGALQALGYME